MSRLGTSPSRKEFNELDSMVRVEIARNHLNFNQLFATTRINGYSILILGVSLGILWVKEILEFFQVFA